MPAGRSRPPPHSGRAVVWSWAMIRAGRGRSSGPSPELKLRPTLEMSMRRVMRWTLGTLLVVVVLATGALLTIGRPLLFGPKARPVTDRTFEVTEADRKS